MGLETSTYIDGLVPANPLGTDVISKGDDHIRLLKSTIKASFPDVDEAVVTIHNGGTAPANKQTGSVWRDTGNSVWKFWNGSAWITLAVDFNTSNKVDVDDGTIDGVTIGTNSACQDLRVDNIQVDGNTISSTDSNGDLNITPNGTGNIVLDGQKFPQADGSNTDYLTTNGSGQLAWTTNTIPTSEANASASATASANSATASANSATASANSLASCQTAQTACEAVLDTFDDRFLGVKSSAPSLDNDSQALQDGALYFNTVSNRMFVFDQGNSVWLQLAPSDQDQQNINVVAGNILYKEDLGSITESVSSSSGSDISTVADSIDNINTVANTTNLNNITSVSGSIANVATTATNIASVNNVSSISSAVSTVSGISSAVSGVNTIASDVSAVSAKSTEVALLGTSANVTAMGLLGNASVISDMSDCSSNASDISTVAGVASGVSFFSDRYRVSANAPTTSLDSGDLWWDETNSELKAYSGSAWQATAPSAVNQQHINNVSGAIVYAQDNGLITDALSTSSTNGDIATVSNNIDEVARLGTAQAVSDLQALGTSANVGHLQTVSGSISQVQAVSSGIADVNRYAEEYTISASAPSSPSAGDLWYDSSVNVLKYRTNTTWASLTAGIAEIVQDTTPQLGGALDCQDNNLSNVGTVDGTNLTIDFGTL